MSGFRPKRPKSKERMRITSLKLEDGRIVTDPAEVNRLLRLNGFTVDDETGAVGLGPNLRRPS
jgi:hypothetical protein